MDQNGFPFADGVEAEPYVDEQQRNRKAMFVAGGVAAALVLGIGGWLLLGGNGDSSVDTAFVPTHRSPRVGATAPRSGTKAPAKLPVAYKAQIGRDPFKALYVQPAPAPVVAPATAVLPGPTAGLGTTGLAGPLSGAGTTPVAPVDKQYTLVLKRVYGSGSDRTAVFSIDGKQQVAKIGTKFGPTSEIVLLSFQQGPKPGQWTTVLQVGDGDPFDIVTGTPSYVR